MGTLLFVTNRTTSNEFDSIINRDELISFASQRPKHKASASTISRSLNWYQNHPCRHNESTMIMYYSYYDYVLELRS